MKNNKISKAWIMLAVSNVEKAKAFYETVLEQKIEGEIEGCHIVFESGFALQADYTKILEGAKEFAPKPTGAKLEIKTKSNSFQLAFEVKDLDYWVTKIKALGDIEIIHDVTEYNWGQRTFRFYDYDGNIVELGEDLAVVAKRFIAQGRTAEEAAKGFGYSLEYVQQLLSSE